MERIDNDANCFPSISILPDGLRALGAFVGGICECVVLTSPLPQKSDLSLSTHVRERVDGPQGQLFEPDPRRWDVV